MADERDLARVVWRLDALDEWRRSDVAPRLQRLEDGVRKLVNAAELADAIAARVNEDRRFHLTRVQAWAAIGVAVVSPVVGGLVVKLL